MSITGITHGSMYLFNIYIMYLFQSCFSFLLQVFGPPASRLNAARTSAGSTKHLRDLLSKSPFTEIHIKATNVKGDSNVAAAVIHSPYTGASVDLSSVNMFTSPHLPHISIGDGETIEKRYFNLCTLQMSRAGEYIRVIMIE